jgi:LSU ribosomal protein L40E
MPLLDASLIQLAQMKRLHYKICRKCGARNPPTAEKCRKCRSYNLRWKKRELGRK